MKQIILLILIFITSVKSVNSQVLTEKDYERAVSFMYDNYNNKTAFNLDTNVNWFKDNSGIWFVDYGKKGKSYKTVSFKKGKVESLFDHSKFADAFSEFSKDSILANAVSISNIESVKGGLQFNYKSDKYELDLKKFKFSKIEKKDKEGENKFETKSPDGKWIAYSKEYNLFIKSIETSEEFQLSFDGKKEYEYASWYGWADTMEGENGERPKRFYVDWSKDSKWISTSVVDLRTAEKMYLLDYSIDSLYKPKLLSYYRGSPGDTTMVHLKSVFYNIETKKEVKTNLPTGTHINSVSTRWSEESGVLFADYPERGYQKLYVKKVDLNSGVEKTLITEESKTNIDNFEYKLFDNDQKLLFLSDRNGWRQIYLLDLKTNITTPLTNGSYYVNSIKHIDEENGNVYFMASGKETKNNPYHQQVYKVDLEGNTILLTPENTHHSVTFSEDGNHFVDNYSTISIPTKTTLRSSKDGKIIAQLTEADISHFTSQGFQSPEVFELIAKDGKTTMYGAFWKPSNLDASKKYPIIDATYTGPHTQRFPKVFNWNFSNQSLAELGFIVVQMDGLGTSGRSKEFLNHSYKNMGNNLEDHVLAIKYLANKHSWIDAERVGIHGRSAGGYDTGRAMVGFPDFYKVGVATSGDHDFRMEKAWWPEMYMGWPVDENYHDASNITNAKNLKGKLLLIHGSLDDNVNPSATFKFAEALIKADKEFDLLIVPSQKHGYRGEYYKYVLKKRWNYFVEHLLETKPIWDFKWE